MPLPQVAAEVLGRRPELAAARVFLERATGGPTALVLEGEPGIGKTTVWFAAVEDARRHGFRLLVACPAAAEAQLSYVLGGPAPRYGVELLDDLPRPQRLAVDGVLLRSDADGMVADQRAIGAALLTVLERLAGTAPVLLALDDLQ